MPKYILCPGYVRSRTDNDIHFITANQLLDLYGVRRSECILRPDIDSPQRNGWEPPPGAIELHPRNDGNYRLPEPDTETQVDRLVEEAFAKKPVRPLTRRVKDPALKCTACPECGCTAYHRPDEFGKGYRLCADCSQEWYTTINYDRYQPPHFYEVFTQLGHSLPPKDRNGDARYFDKRSVRRRIRKLIRQGWSVTAFVTKPGKGRQLIYSNWPPNAMNAIGI